METNSLNFFGRELPSSLGYGVLDKSSVKIDNEVISADFNVPLARMWSAAGTFAGHGIIDPCKPNRLIIDKSGNAGSTFMQIWPGDLKNPCFAIVFKDCDEKQREGIAKLLSESLRAKKSALKVFHWITFFRDCGWGSGGKPPKATCNPGRIPGVRQNIALP